MLKIKSIRLNNQPAIHFDDKFTFIFGGNNVGKTLLVNTINYMLGQSTHDIWKKQGMEHITLIELNALCDDNTQLFLKRTIEKKNYYKRSKNDGYSLVDDLEYKNIVQSAFCVYDEDLYKSYYSIVGESLSYRGIAYLNFINQYSLGDSTNIIPEANDVVYYNRIKKQTMFIFDKAAQQKLNDCRERLKVVDAKIKEVEELIKKRNFALDGLKKEFEYLSLHYSDDVNELKETFLNYKAKSKMPNDYQRGEKELIYLTKASSQIYSQIAIERRLAKQTELLSNRNKKTEELLKCFRSVIGNSSNFSKYIQSIEQVLEEYGKRDAILSVKNFEGTISFLESEKKKVDQRIQDISNDLTEKTYIDYSKSEATIERYFEMIDSIYNIANIEELYTKQRDIKKEMDIINENLKVPSTEQLNKQITDSYLKMPEDLKFVKEDKEKEITIQYIPRRRSLEARMKTKDGENVNYVPGSKARQTCWQIITFIELHKFIKDNYPNYPLLPLLIVDGFNEPFTEKDESLQKISTYFLNLCSERGIQLMVVSTSSVSKKVFPILDLSSGFNKER